MAATTEQKVDFLLKKIGYVASKTGIAEDESSLSGTKKAPFAESIPSPLVTPSTSIWADASLIPSTPPGSDTSYVKVYLTGTSGVRMTVDNTVSGNRTFLARSTYGNDSSAILGDWIDTSFSADYIIKVFKGDPNSGGVQLSAAGAGSNDTWFFDYSSGVLNFNGTQIPSGVTSSNIYIVGYRYIGAKGGRPAAGIATFASLDVSGISTFRDDVNFISANGNNILFDKSDNALEFGDNVKLRFGASNDLTLFHNASDSVITHSAAGEGNLKILSGGAQSIECIKAGAVNITHNGSTKIETTSHGAVITGVLTATSFSGGISGDSIGNVYAASGISTFYDLRVSNNLTVEGTTTTLDTNLIGVDRVEVGADSNTVVGVAVTQSGTADIVNLFDGATKVVTVDDVGNVGIGSATPGGVLDLYHASSNTILNVKSGDAGAVINITDNATRSSIDIIFKLNFLATFIKSGTLAIEPSSFIISTITPAGFNPASLGKSIAASVCPVLLITPPLFATSGNTWPGFEN